MKRINNSSGDWSYFQASNPLLKKINFNKSNQISFLKTISRLNSTLKVRDNKIFAVAGDNEEQFNENTISLIAFKYSKMIKKTLPESKRFVIVAHDESGLSHSFSTIFSAALANYGIQVYNFLQNHATPYPLSFFAMNFLKIQNIVYFSKRHSITNLYGISFKNIKNKFFTEEQNNIMNSELALEDINFKKIDSIKIVKYLDSSIFDNYVDYLIKKKKINKSKDFSFSFIALSSSHRYFLDEVFRRLNYVFQEDKFHWKNKIKNNSFIETLKQPHFFNYLGKKVHKEKSDLGFIFSNDGTELSCIVKNKRLLKHLDYSTLSILYANYLKETSNTNVAFYHAKTASSNFDIFAKRIPESVVSQFTLRTDVLEKMSHIKKKLTFAFDDESRYLVSYGKALSGFDAITFAIAVLEMASYYKEKGKNLFQVFEEIEESEGIIHENVEKFYSNKEEALNLITRLLKIKEIRGLKVVRKERFVVQTNFINLILRLEDKTKIVIKFNNFKNQLTYLVSLAPQKKHFSKITTKEKEIIDEINALNENLESKKPLKMSIIKYTFSFLFLVLIFYLMFTFVYSQKNNGSIDGILIFKDVWAIFRQSYLIRFYFILIAFSLFFYSVIHSWTIYLMMKKQKIQIKFTHLFLSSFIGICVSNVTPLYIGGDLASFWYLRRKGYRTSALAATFLASAFIYQITMVVIGLILIPFMFSMFGFIFNKDTTEALILSALLISSILFNTFMVLLYWIIAAWKWLQVRIVSSIIFILEFLPFTFILDPRKISGSKYYGFDKTREGFQKILKAPALFISVFLVRLVVAFVTFSPFVAILSGLLKQDLYGGSYWYLLVANNVVRSINSISITPGGVGTGDAILLFVVQQAFLDNASLAEVFRDRNIDVYFRDGPKLYGFLNQILFYIYPTLISGLTLFTVWIGEKRLDKYRAIQISQNLSLDKNTILMSKRSKTRFFKIASSLWILGTVGFIALLMLI